MKKESNSSGTRTVFLHLKIPVTLRMQYGDVIKMLSIINYSLHLPVYLKKELM